ncbi:MAG: CHASE3 domain-containing protein, partial [Candidatus Omnitrophica bacterium]|nr:CHASE3 domain-containing protein [Candidatus Omnitrophota bacterium]
MTKHLSDLKAKTQSKYLVALIFLAAASLLIAGIVISYQVGISLLQAQQKMVEQLSIINRISDVMSNIKDVETGQRGYLLTREEPYLEPYKVAIGKLKIELSLLQELAAKGRVSQNQVDRITGLIQQKLDETNLTIDLNRKKGLSSALKIVKNDRGMVLMDQIRAELG